MGIIILVSNREKKTPSPIRNVSPKPLPSPSPVSRTRTRTGSLPTFKSGRLIVSSNPGVTFNYVKDPLTDGSTGYFKYNNQPNMLNWPVALPLNFTHAKVFTSTGGVREEKIFEFREPNSSDTYGKFVSGTPPPSDFFTDRMDLGTFF